METLVAPIALEPTQPCSLLKRVSLSTFRALRGVGTQAKAVPGLLAQAKHDIHEAWQESARPNV